MALIDGLRVLDFTTGITGGYTAKLLGDIGADVVKVEPAEGDPLRQRSATRGRVGGLFAFLHGGHRSIVGEATDDSVRALASEADVVLESGGPTDDRARRLRDDAAHLATVSISPFGLTGAMADRPASEFTLQALSGSTGSRGRKDTPPTHAAGELLEWYAAPCAATAALAGWRQAQRSGRGPHVDLSVLEVGCLVSQYATVMKSFFGDPPMPARQRIIMIPCVEPTLDGWVGFSTITAKQWHAFVELVEAHDLDDAELSSSAGRLGRAEEITPIIRAWTSQHTTDEIIERATALRVPVAPIGTGATIADLEHFAARGVYAGHPDGFVAPLPPWRIPGDDPREHRPSPALGEHERASWHGRATSATRPSAPSASGQQLPLTGVRVVDFTMFWAGPAATHALAALGADVIKIESVQRPDGIRFTSARGPGTEKWWEWGWIFHGINTNKRGITLDLDRPEGREIARRLVEQADLVIENYTPRVMERFGLDWSAIHDINPSAVMLRMPGFGLTGPWRDWPGWANTMEQASGLAAISGWPDSEPWIPNGQLDAIAGWHAALLAIAALEARDRTSGGVLVELPMAEVGCTIAAEQVIEWSAAGRLRERDGNHGPFAAPQGAYACSGREQWLALSVTSDDQWQALVGWLEHPDWAVDPKLSTHEGRNAAGTELDQQLGRIFCERDLDQTVTELLDAGIAAARVTTPTELLDLDAPAARGFFERVDHSVTGSYDVPTVPFRWSGVDHWVRQPAPTLGQDNDAVLASLGIDEASLRQLRDEHVIGDEPLDV